MLANNLIFLSASHLKLSILCNFYEFFSFKTKASIALSVWNHFLYPLFSSSLYRFIFSLKHILSRLLGSTESTSLQLYSLWIKNLGHTPLFQSTDMGTLVMCIEFMNAFMQDRLKIVSNDSLDEEIHEERPIYIYFSKFSYCSFKSIVFQMPNLLQY